MLGRAFVFLSCVFVLSGCIYNDEPMPEITQSSFERPKVIQPVIVEPPQPQKSTPLPSGWLPPSRLEKRWSAIIIHHSGTKKGNAAIFDKWHKQGNHWEGVGYDFIIGNGSDSGNGQVEVTYRWRGQKTGAHCGGTANNWANRDGIGICLVGDFNQSVPASRQMQSLLKLVRFLQKRYDISKSRIYGHNTTPGARATDCPGRNFPMARLKSMLDF